LAEQIIDLHIEIPYQVQNKQARNKSAPRSAPSHAWPASKLCTHESMKVYGRNVPNSRKEEIREYVGARSYFSVLSKFSQNNSRNFVVFVLFD
jgi:hypothetical protein